MINVNSQVTYKFHAILFYFFLIIMVYIKYIVISFRGLLTASQNCFLFSRFELVDYFLNGFECNLLTMGVPDEGCSRNAS